MAVASLAPAHAVHAGKRCRCKRCAKPSHRARVHVGCASQRACHQAQMLRFVQVASLLTNARIRAAIDASPAKPWHQGAYLACVPQLCVPFKTVETRLLTAGWKLGQPLTFALDEPHSVGASTWRTQMPGLLFIGPALEVSRFLLGRQPGDSVLGLLQRCLVRRFLLGCHGRWLRGLLLGWLHGLPSVGASVKDTAACPHQATKPT